MGMGDTEARSGIFGNSIKLFSIAGFEVRLHVSWLVIVTLIIWSLATGFFPSRYPGLTAMTYWWMGLAGAVGLFVSIILHELSHSVVGRKYQIPMKGITLFVFGGVAEMSDEPPSAKAEFRMAVVGPLTSMLLSFAFYALFLSSQIASAPVMVTGAFFYLALINGLLALFNLIPAFPLDGGRILRSIIWHFRHDLLSATRTAAAVGSGFSFLLMIFGFADIFRGDVLGGVWWILIGMFLNGAASAGIQQVEIRSALQGESIRRFMKADPITVSPDLSIRELVDDFVYKYHFKMFPVVQDSKLLGCISTKEVRELARDEWERLRVADVARPCGMENSVSPTADAMEVLSVMNQTGNSRMVVRENDRLIGIVSLKDMLGHLALKLELEGPHVKGPDLRKAA